MTDRQSTHADGCWSWGRGHYECAVGKIEQLEERVQRDEALLRQALEALKKVAQSLEWYAHGRCRGFDDGAPLPTHEAVEFAERTLARCAPDREL